MLNTANNVQNTPAFNGYLHKALNNLPYPSPQTPMEHEENVLTIGKGAGMDTAIALKTIGNTMLLTAGATAGAFNPKKTLNAVSSFIGKEKEPIAKVSRMMRTKAALIGGVAAVGAVNAASVIVRTIKGIFFPDRILLVKSANPAPAAPDKAIKKEESESGD